MKKIKTLSPKPAVKQEPSKPQKTGLSKSDPDYFKKIGQISAAKRSMTSEDFAAMVRKSHPRVGKSKGGRPKKNAALADA